MVYYPDIRHTADSRDYIVLAEQIKNLDFSEYEGGRVPMYSVLILISQNLNILFYIQLFLHFLNSYIIFSFLNNLTNSKIISFFASLIYLTYPPAINIARGIMSETLATTLILLSFYYFYRAFKLKKFNYLILVVLLSSLAALTRPIYLNLPVLLIIFTSFKLYKTKNKSAFKIVSFQTALLILLILPVFIFNYILLNQFTFTTLLGCNLTSTVSICIEDKSDNYKYERRIYVEERDKLLSNSNHSNRTIWFASNRLTEEKNYKFPEISKIFFIVSINTILEHPGCYLRNVLTGIYKFWNPLQGRIFSDIKKILSNFSRILLTTINILFILSVFFLKSKKNEKSDDIDRFTAIFIFIFVFFISITQAMTEYGDNFRFSYPTVPLIIVISFYIISVIGKKKIIKNKLTIRKSE